MSVVFDSSALLAIAFEEDGAAVAARALSGGIVSAVNASEVVAKFVDLGSGEDDARESFLAFGLHVRPFDETLAVAAGADAGRHAGAWPVARRSRLPRAGDSRARHRTHRGQGLGGARSGRRRGCHPLTRARNRMVRGRTISQPKRTFGLNVHWWRGR